MDNTTEVDAYATTSTLCGAFGPTSATGALGTPTAFEAGDVLVASEFVLVEVTVKDVDEETVCPVPNENKAL